MHYLAIAGAKLIFTEEDVLQKVEMALHLSGEMNIRPTVALLGVTAKDVKYKVVWSFPSNRPRYNKLTKT